MGGESMLEATNLFPQGHAVGEAFCNREHERNQLKHSFLNGEHTVIVAPRRYGKSSLIRQVLLDTGLPGTRIDLLPATNVMFVQKGIKACFYDLINQISPKTKQAKQKLISFMQEYHPKLTLSLLGQKLEVTATRSPDTSIVDLLIGLDAVAKECNKRVVVCLDEFQQVGLLKEHHSLEASIRHAVEISTNVTYMFSGSSRHLLRQMFSSKSRPLYHLCEIMEIDRIKEDTYFSILFKRAITRWGTSIKEAVISEILSLTKCHPYYVNALCRQIWKLEESPAVNIVQKTWFGYINTQKNWIRDDLVNLTPNQRNIIGALAYAPTAEPYGNEFVRHLNIGASSIKKSLSILLRKDFVYKDSNNGKFRVLDPVVEAYLHQIKYFDFIEQ